MAPALSVIDRKYRDRLLPFVKQNSENADSTMASPKLTLYLDVVSPFAYIAFWVTRNSPVFKKCDITYVPIFLGGVMKACDNRPPIEIKNKDKWIQQERLRWASSFKIPMSKTGPQPFPQPTLQTQRALCAVEQGLSQEKLARCFEALYQAFWVEEKPVGKVEVFGPILQQVLGEKEAKEVLEKGKGDEAKKQLSRNSDEAMAEGAFGLPWFVATNSKGEKETFWGVDHMAQVVDHLGLERKANETGFRAML